MHSSPRTRTHARTVNQTFAFHLSLRPTSLVLSYPSTLVTFPLLSLIFPVFLPFSPPHSHLQTPTRSRRCNVMCLLPFPRPLKLSRLLCLDNRCRREAPEAEEEERDGGQTPHELMCPTLCTISSRRAYKHRWSNLPNSMSCRFELYINVRTHSGRVTYILQKDPLVSVSHYSVEMSASLKWPIWLNWEPECK